MQWVLSVCYELPLMARCKTIVIDPMYYLPFQTGHAQKHTHILTTPITKH
jgi:hypothetical protein